MTGICCRLHSSQYVLPPVFPPSHSLGSFASLQTCPSSSSRTYSALFLNWGGFFFFFNWWEPWQELISCWRCILPCKAHDQFPPLPSFLETGEWAFFYEQTVASQRFYARWPCMEDSVGLSWIYFFPWQLIHYKVLMNFKYIMKRARG